MVALVRLCRVCKAIPHRLRLQDGRPVPLGVLAQVRPLGVGQGGFGEIYYAVSDSGKEVALKLIRRNLEVELRGIRQCLNLKHPHDSFCQVLDSRSGRLLYKDVPCSPMLKGIEY